MTSQQQYTRNVQFGRVSGDNNTFDVQKPHIHNSNTTHNQNADYFSADDADADADADTDMDANVNAATAVTTATPAKMNTNTNTSMSPTTGSSPSVCHTCNRKFKRRCDLNRHRRTHTRPFKCQLPNCEYSKRGFPTSQERQRHMDDRHSDKPPTFHCTFKGCKYSSKRESNCKQHMEKTHGWKYDRSRNNNNNNNAGRAASNDKVERGEDNEVDLDLDADADADGETESVQTKQKEEDDEKEVAFKHGMPAFGAVPAPVAASSTLSPTGEDYAMHQQQLLQYQQLQLQQFNNNLSHASTPMPMMSNEADFILYPDNQPQQMVMGNGVTAALAADGSVVYTTADTPAVTVASTALRAVNASPAADTVSNSFVPWESPLTQQEEISNLIRRFELQPQQQQRQQQQQQQQRQQQMASMTPPTRPLGYNQGQRVPAASSYPQAISYFAPADYHAAQVALPASVPGSAVASAAAAGDYGAAFSPPSPFTGTPHAFRQPQQNAGYTSPHTPLVGVPTLFPQAWPALLSTTAAQQQRQQQVFAEQAAALRQKSRAKAEAEAVLALVKTAPMSDESVTVAAGGRGIKRDHDAFERDASNTANINDNGNGNDDGDDGDEDEDENDGNNRRPSRPPRAGHNNPDDIDDDHMPCPYHLTDPGYFDRDNEERFSPCHTQHRYISTLFRHLGRAAHNLIITENSASSFGVHEAGNRPQLQAGLCRRCWTSFTDQAAFNAHVEHGRPCARASRSKREKYSQILRTFCAPRPVTATTPAPAAAPATPAPAAPIPRAAQQPALQPAAPIESNAGRVAPPQVRVQMDLIQATPVASSSARGPATMDPKSPDIKVSPTQQEALSRPNILADLNPNSSAPGPVQGRANPPPKHKQHNSVESATLVDVDYYVSRTEFQGFTQTVTQRLSALEAMVQQIGAGVGSATIPATTRPAGSSSSTRPPSSLGPGPSRSVISVLQTDASAHERGSLVREMDRQTILEEEEEEADNTSRSRHRRNHHYHHSQESHMSGAIGALDANQMLAGIGEPLRTLSGLSSSSDASSVRHVPPPASVSEDNSRSRQLRQQQQQQHQQQQQQAQSILTTDMQQPQQLLQQLDQQGEQQQAQNATRQRHQHEEAETLPDTAPETVADSGYGSNDNNKIPHQRTTGTTLPVVHEVTANVSFGSLLGLEAKNVDNDHAPDNVNIDDGFQLPSMFDEDENDDFNETNMVW